MREEERLRIYDQIDELLTNHCRKCPNNNARKHYMTICRGCPVLDQLQALGKQLMPRIRKDFDEEFDEVLAKGQDMTLSEVRRLIESGCPEKSIRKALGMNLPKFYEFVKDLYEGVAL